MVKEYPVIDVVMPAFNEQLCIRRSVEALFAAVEHLPYRFELIVVDDGSSDDTAVVIRRLQRFHPIKLVRFSRNFGKEAALLAGLDHACGDATIIMDADLQHPVAVVARFIELWEAGYDCVYAVREDRDDEAVFKRVQTRLFYSLINRGADVRIPKDALDFRLLDRAVVKALVSLREKVRFTKGLYAWLGFNSVAVPVSPGPRHCGSSRFTFSRLNELAWDGLTSFSGSLMRSASGAGFVIAGAAVGFGSYLAVRSWLLGDAVPGWETMTDVLSLVGGLQLVFLGILGQYLRNIFIELKQRPTYLVAEFSQSDLCTKQRVATSIRERVTPRPSSAEQTGSAVPTTSIGAA